MMIESQCLGSDKIVIVNYYCRLSLFKTDFANVNCDSFFSAGK